MVLPPPPTSRTRLPIALAAALALVDQGTKALVVRSLGPDAPSHRIDLLAPVLGLEYVENRGAAFGVLRGQGALLALLALLVLAALVVSYRRLAAPEPRVAIGIGLVAGGAIGNLIDRIRLGYVIDFVAVGPWPKFNAADSAITIGVLILSYQILVRQPDTPRSRSEIAGDHRRSRPTLPADG